MSWRPTRPSDLARRIAEAGIPYVAFGGGEPLGVPHCWDIFDILAAAGIAIKIETDGSRIDAAAADRLAALDVDCIQISVDGANATTHERVRPGSSFAAAVGAIERLVARGYRRSSSSFRRATTIDEIVDAFDLASEARMQRFRHRARRCALAGPRVDWQRIGCSDDAWQRAVAALREERAAVDAS
jgi:MoaA/NifB/PqqE/SkfB family radical SAM enzyme